MQPVGQTGFGPERHIRGPPDSGVCPTPEIPPRMPAARHRRGRRSPVAADRVAPRCWLRFANLSGARTVTPSLTWIIRNLAEGICVNLRLKVLKIDCREPARIVAVL